MGQRSVTKENSSQAALSRVSKGVPRVDEFELIRRLKQGDLDAFDAIYDIYRARLFSFLFRLTRRREIAEELLQETWLRLAHRAHTLRDDTRPGAWLFTVAHNLFASYCRNRALDTERISEMAAAAISGEERSPFDMAAARETERSLERVIASLPPRYREVLLLIAEGFSHQEAATICDLRPDAFRKRLSRAREMVVAQLHEHGSRNDAGY